MSQMSLALNPEPEVRALPAVVQETQRDGLFNKVVVVARPSEMLSAFEQLVIWNRAYERFREIRLAKSANTWRAYGIWLDDFFGREGGSDSRPVDWRMGSEVLVALHENMLAAGMNEETFETKAEALLGSMGTLPWKTTSAAIFDWLAVLKSRSVVRGAAEPHPLSDASIAQALAAVSSFYEFVSSKYTITYPDGREDFLHPRNPARAVERPEVDPYGKSISLSPEQIVRMRQAVKRTIKGAHVLDGLRDDALLSFYFYTGCRNSEIRELRWQDITPDQKQFVVRAKGKKQKPEKRDLPKPVWTALEKYLRLAQRLDGMQPEDYLFIAHSDRAARLNTTPADWRQGAKALSMSEIGRLVKKYARLAGLDERQVHPHVLRHAAIMLRREVGDDPADIQRFAGHASLGTTGIYLNHMNGRKDASWKKVEALIGLPEDEVDLPFEHVEYPPLTPPVSQGENKRS